jgi:hypothetical protein
MVFRLKEGHYMAKKDVGSQTPKTPEVGDVYLPTGGVCVGAYEPKDSAGKSLGKVFHVFAMPGTPEAMAALRAKAKRLGVPLDAVLPPKTAASSFFETVAMGLNEKPGRIDKGRETSFEEDMACLEAMKKAPGFFIEPESILGKGSAKAGKPPKSKT